MRGRGTYRMLRNSLLSGHFRSAGLQIMVVAIVLLLAGMVMLGSNVSELNASYAWAQRTNTTLLHVADLNHSMVGIEMSVRGYALTGKPIYREYYAYDRGQLERNAAALNGELADRPQAAARIKTVMGLLEERLADFDRLIALGPGRITEVAAAIEDVRIRRIRLDIDRNLDEIRNTQLILLKSLQDASEDKVRDSYRMAIFTVVAAFLLGVFGLFLVQSGSIKTKH